MNVKDWFLDRKSDFDYIKGVCEEKHCDKCPYLVQDHYNGEVSCAAFDNCPWWRPVWMSIIWINIVNTIRMLSKK